MAAIDRLSKNEALEQYRQWEYSKYSQETDGSPQVHLKQRGDFGMDKALDFSIMAIHMQVLQDTNAIDHSEVIQAGFNAQQADLDAKISALLTPPKKELRVKAQEEEEEVNGDDVTGDLEAELALDFTQRAKLAECTCTILLGEKVTLVSAVRGSCIVHVRDMLAVEQAEEKGSDNLLSIAASRQQTDCLALLLEHSQWIDRLMVCDSFGDAPIHAAAAAGNVNSLRLLVGKGGDAWQPGSSGWTSLHYSSESNATACVEYLLSLPGANVDCVEETGKSALHVAAFYADRLPVIKLLLAAGASGNLPDNAGNTVLHVAMTWGHVSLGQELIHSFPSLQIDAVNGEGETPLHAAIRQGHLAAVQWLHSMGASLTLTNQQGDTALHIAALSQHLPICLYLIREGNAWNLAEVRNKAGKAVRHILQVGHMLEACEGEASRSLTTSSA